MRIHLLVVHFCLLFFVCTTSYTMQRIIEHQVRYEEQTAHESEEHITLTLPAPQAEDVHIRRAYMVMACSNFGCSMASLLTAVVSGVGAFTTANNNLCTAYSLTCLTSMFCTGYSMVLGIKTVCELKK